MQGLLAFLSDYTIQNVLTGSLLLGVSSGTLGIFAVLRRQSLLGDALSHATLPGVALGFMVAGSRDLAAITAGALVSGTLAAYFVLLLVNRTRLKADAALGSALSIFFALGVILLTHVQKSGSAAQGGLDSFLFGQAAAILRSDLVLIGSLTAALLLLVVIFWKEFKLVTFDPLYARSLGMPVPLLEALLTFAIALAIVIGLQLVGVVLMSAMLVAPAVAARQWTVRLEGMAVASALFGAVAGATGALISATGPNLSTGPVIVLVASALVVVSLLFAPGRGVLWARLDSRSTNRRLRDLRLLEAVYRVAEEHEDLGYPVEEGMLRAYAGRSAGASLDSLSRAGLLEPARHMPEEGRHWKLTEEGLERARRFLNWHPAGGPEGSREPSRAADREGGRR